MIVMEWKINLQFCLLSIFLEIFLSISSNFFAGKKWEPRKTIEIFPKVYLIGF